MRYDKYAAHFVMLQEQNNVFAFRTTLPIKGHVKIETGNGKGAMRVVVQNMRYYERGPYIYKLILFGKKRERTIHSVMGSVAINRYGNGETYIRFNPFDIDSKGNPLSAFSVAILVAVSIRNEKESLHPVLKGEIVIGEEYDRLDDEESDVYEDDFGEEEESIGDLDILAEEEAQQEKGGLKHCYNNYYNRYLIESCQRTIRMSRYYDDVVPFKDDKTNAKWKKIVNVGNLPIVSPGAQYFASKYKHYIFGITEEMCYIGIPGRLMNEEQPDGGESGFVYWQPIIGAMRQRDAYGYWISAIDLLTGDIQEV